ncbi:MAG TPA: DNA primase [Terriglobales bacterium]|nr:DNA primase [Terriglobales bacterium]
MPNPGDFAYTVKQQADIVRIVGEYVKLKKSGAQNFSGLCPFHDEKSPSFSVHASRQFFHCFGCGVSGDVFSFVQKIENVTFPEAVRSIATKLNIPLPKQQFSPQEAKEASQRGKLLDLHEAACTFFQLQLKTSGAASAREYLTSRGLTDEMLAQFRIGYAPDSGFLLRDQLKGDFDEGTLKQSGLFSWKDEEGGTGAMYAKFRNRIIFPIFSEQGKVIAFGGRILASGTTAADKDKAGPKYLNSPETLIYSKGKVLYNLDKAREAIRKLDYSIVVEGYLDCISVFTAGMHNVIASSGTAFGEAQVKLLGRYSKNIVVNFDPDTAGAAATERSLAMLIEEDFNIKVITLEPGLDPDLFIRKRGVEAYQAEVRGSRKYFHYLIDRALAQFPKTPEGKVKAMNYLLPHIQRVPSRIARDELASEAAQRLAIDSAVLRQELKSAASSRSKTIKQDASQGPGGLSPAEKVLVSSLLAAGSSNSQVRATLQQTLEEERPHEGWGAEALLDALAQADPATLAQPLSLPLSDIHRKHLAEILMATEEGEEPSADSVRLALAALRRPHLERKLQHLQPQIDEAGRKGDSFKLAQLSAEKLKLKRALDESMRAVNAK